MSNRTRSTTAAIVLALALSACGDGSTETTAGAQEVAPAPVAFDGDQDDPSGTRGTQSADAAERWALARAEGCTTGLVSADAAEACLATR